MNASVCCWSGKSGLDFHDKAQQLRELTSRLPAAVRGDDEYWIRRVREEAGMTIMFYYAEVLPKMAECDRDVTQASAASVLVIPACWDILLSSPQMMG